MNKDQRILVLAFRAIALALAAVSLALEVLGAITTAIVTLWLALLFQTLAGCF
jgi:fatty acid desaturase